MSESRLGSYQLVNRRLQKVLPLRQSRKPVRFRSGPFVLPRIKPKLAIAVLAVTVSALACGKHANVRPDGVQLNDDEKHRLYSAALAASEFPLDSALFREVCQAIGIFDAQGQPNERYVPFVSQHVAWGTKPENESFQREIATKEKAREYINKHAP